MSKTLYVSDLDGTLLLPSQKLSTFTADTINRLVSEGMIFSYATARSSATAIAAAEDISVDIPIITNNGVFIKDSQSGKILHGNYFSTDEAKEICLAMNGIDLYPIVYSIRPEGEKFTYCHKLISRETLAFIDTRRGDGRDLPIDEPERQWDGKVFYFSIIGDGDKLRSICRHFDERFHCIFSKNIYDDEYWLEIMPKTASKASAILELKNLLGCERVICFGDAENDIPMFRIADEAYAMENAVPELKAIATGIIDSNSEDGVARWLLDNFR